MSAAAERIPVPLLRSRTLLRWQLFTVALVVGTQIWHFVTYPDQRWYVLLLLPPVAVFATWVATFRIWVEPGTGTVVMRRFSHHRRVRLAAARAVRLIGSGDRGVQLMVSEGGGLRRSIFLPLLALGMYVERSQDAATLRILADQLDRWAPAHAELAQLLRRQAAHEAAGGAPDTSPLAPFVGASVLGGAAGAGGVGAGSSLLD